MTPRSRLAWFFGLLLTTGAAAALLGWALGHSTGSIPSVARAESPRPALERDIVCFGYVDVDHGVTALSPLKVGRVAELLVQEGQTVAAGDPLLRLESNADQAHAEKARASVNVAEAQLAQAKQVPPQDKARRAQQKASVEAVRCRLAGAEHNLIRKRDLQKAQQLNIQEVAAAVEQVQELKAMLEAERQKLAELEQHDPALDIRRAEAEVAAARANLSEACHALDECALKAPTAGKVLRILVGPGDLVGGQASQQAVMFCTGGPRLIRAEVEQEYVRHLVTGLKTLAEDDSRAGGTWKGQVKRVSDWYTKRRAVMREPLQTNDVRTVECVIELDANQPPLRIGQRMRVVIHPAR